MSEPLLRARNLSVRFGGVLAVNDVSFDVQRDPSQYPNWQRRTHYRQGGNQARFKNWLSATAPQIDG